jgi:hypothetical protein
MTKYLIGKIAYSVMCLIGVGLAFLVADTIEVFGLCLMITILSGFAVVAIEMEELKDKD